jgi:hypothetical protein
LSYIIIYRYIYIYIYIYVYRHKFENAGQLNDSICKFVFRRPVGRNILHNKRIQLYTTVVSSELLLFINQ